MGSEIIVAPQSGEVERFLPVMNIDQAIARREVIVQATARLMKEGVDFGAIPGTGTKPSLLQPGADKLCNLFGLTIRYEITREIEDFTGVTQPDGQPLFYYRIKGSAYRGDHFMGEGVGSCSSHEPKYRYRTTERTCPQCGKANIRKSKDGGWYCWKKTDGCGANFKKGDPDIESQETGRKLNPDVAELANTILKMAYKRCKISTTINATSASEFFTQDIDPPAPGSGDQDHQERPTAAAKPRAATPATASRTINVQPEPEPPEPPDGHPDQGPGPDPKPWRNFGEMRQRFMEMRKRYAGDTDTYDEILAKYGVATAEQFKKAEQALHCYRELEAALALPDPAKDKEPLRITDDDLPGGAELWRDAQ